jgi:integrase
MSRRPRAQRITDQVFAAVIRAFLRSPKWQDYAPSTKDTWGRELRLMEDPDALGALSVYDIRPALVQAFFDGNSGKQGKQEVGLKVLKQLEKWATVRDMLPRPITTGVEVPKSDEGHRPWRDEHIALAERYARRGFDRVVTLASNTGQRGSDIVRMRWTDIETVDGRPGISVVQQKTGLPLWVPFTQALIAALDTWERTPGFILRRQNGKPWTRKQLSSEWPLIRDGVPELKPLSDLGLTLHGLRATACIRLSRAGANTRQVAAMVGMAEKQVAMYCRFSEQRENAMAALLHLENFRGRQPIDNKR